MPDVYAAAVFVQASEAASTGTVGPIRQIGYGMTASTTMAIARIGARLAYALWTHIIIG